MAGLKLKPRKCWLAVERVSYLGYIVSKHGIAADEQKMAAVRRFLRPINVKQV